MLMRLKVCVKIAMVNIGFSKKFLTL